MRRASEWSSGVHVTPTWYINGRKYLGLWDSSEFTNALLGTLGQRVREAALDFARWAPSAGILLLIATIVSVLLTNSALGAEFQSLWQIQLGFRLGDWSVGLPSLARATSLQRRSRSSPLPAWLP
ncbi:MAG TPA: hypothetical protein VFK39_11300 [Gemmatimonadaceae bacterium]|nr:hypothetical protein [Gemmatimonadaceae bacterium]